MYVVGCAECVFVYLKTLFALLLIVCGDVAKKKKKKKKQKTEIVFENTNKCDILILDWYLLVGVLNSINITMYCCSET